MKWTDDKPTEGGFHWIRSKDPKLHGMRAVVEIIVDAEGGHAALMSRGAHWMPIPDDCEWAGPIPEPEE